MGGGASCCLGVGCCGLSNGGSGENTGSSAGMPWSIPWCSGAVRNPGHCFGSPGAGQSAGGKEGGTTQGYLLSISVSFRIFQFVFISFYVKECPSALRGWGMCWRLSQLSQAQ